MDGPNRELPRRLEELTARVAELEAEVDRLRAALAAEAAVAERNEAEAAVEARQAVNALQADLVRSRRRAEAAGRRADLLAKEIMEIRDSFTWRAGRVVKRTVDPAIAARDAVSGRRRKPPAPRRRRPATSGGTDTSGGQGDGASVEAGSLAEAYPVTDDPLRSSYEREVSRRDFSGQPGNGPRVAMAVLTTDLYEGRGDVYVAAGIGRQLRATGAGVAYLPIDDWEAMPDGTDAVVAMLPGFRPSLVPTAVRCVAWVRNEMEAWLAHPELALFDGLMVSSDQARAAISRVYDGPTTVLRIGVDPELFAPPGPGEDRHGVVGTVNFWGKERDLHRALQAGPTTVPLALFGRDTGLPPALAGYSAGPVSFFALPGLYRQATVVLDDFNHTTVGWGNVNSRLYEALACGALVVTNTDRGLVEVGLGEVPTFGDGVDLNSLLEGLLADGAGTADLAARLSATVRTRHGYPSRAAELLRFLEEVGVAAPPRSRTVVAFYPGDYHETNPYQDMLYGGLGEMGAIAVPTMEAFDPAGLGEFARADGAKVFHIHWTAPILGPATSGVDATARVRQVLAGLDAFREGGGRLIWTVHNALPHECRHRAQEIELRQGLADRADVVHVMCDATVAAVSSLYSLPAERTVVIPHSSFLGVYGDALDRASARRYLGVDKDDVVLLAIGGIRRYKGIDRLLDAFDRALRAERRLRLVVAGRPGRFEELAELEKRCRQHRRVIARFDRIEDEELQVFLKASDVAVLPHRAVLNSGSLLLAYTFGLPVIAPTAGCLVDLLDPGASIGFDPEDDDALLGALRRVRSLTGPAPRRAARAVAERYTPPDMAADFAAVLRRLVG
jgi:glycosyltransferase involved in cell wall biosynthesis